MDLRHYDGLMRRRLTTPFVRNNNGELVQADWETAITTVAQTVSTVQRGLQLDDL